MIVVVANKPAISRATIELTTKLLTSIVCGGWMLTVPVGKAKTAPSNQQVIRMGVAQEAELKMATKLFEVGDTVGAIERWRQLLLP